MLREGMIVTVHHDCGVVTGPYRIIEVQGDSHTEPSFSDAVELGSDAPKSKPHYHLLCRKVGERYGFYWLIGYDDTLQDVWGGSHLVIENELSINLIMLLIQ